MSPEMLNKQRYKKSSDIFSFAVTLYEVFSWEEAYPKQQFRFPWQIAEFITSGKRLILTLLPLNIQRIIEMSLCHHPNDRLKIEDIVSLLETEYLKYVNT